MPDIHFSNLSLDDQTEYFLYIGELKNYGLNVFLQEALSRIFRRKFDFIAVVPDVFEQYNYDNLVVINPLTASYACKYGPNVSCRISAPDFVRCVSENRKIHSLIHRLLRRQTTVFLYMYESLPEMTLDEIEGVEIIGPDKTVAHCLNSKIYQYRHLKDIIPLVEFDICQGRQALDAALNRRRQDWSDGIFVTREYSAAGINSLLASSPRDIQDDFGDGREPYLISRYVPHVHDPTVLGVVANADEIYIAGVADQVIENGTRFTGSHFPTVLDANMVRTLEGHTIQVGKWMARQGYRGIFGCDYIVTADGDIRFMEINARKQGTTLEFCCTLDQSLPNGAPNLPELEYYAVMEDILPVNTAKMAGNPKNLHWGTFNYKIHHTVLTDTYIPQGAGERDAFRKVANGNLKKDFLILEHAGSDFVIAEGAFIGRIVALGRDHDSVMQGLTQGKKTIELTIKQYLTPEDRDAES